MSQSRLRNSREKKSVLGDEDIHVMCLFSSTTDSVRSSVDGNQFILNIQG